MDKKKASVLQVKTNETSLHYGENTYLNGGGTMAGMDICAIRKRILANVRHATNQYSNEHKVVQRTRTDKLGKAIFVFIEKKN